MTAAGERPARALRRAASRCVAAGGELNHTHSADADARRCWRRWAASAAGPRRRRPRLGRRGRRRPGSTTVGFADCNDPALFVGEAEGKVAVVVPLDDNVLPHLYAPADRLPAGPPPASATDGPRLPWRRQRDRPAGVAVRRRGARGRPRLLRPAADPARRPVLVDSAPGWLRGSDELFAELYRTGRFSQRTVRMWERDGHRAAPDAGWDTEVDGATDAGRRCARSPPRCRTATASRSTGSGSTSTATARQRRLARRPQPAHPRRTRWWRRSRSAVAGGSCSGHAGHGPPVSCRLGHGDLVVMGGACQHEWEHTVPKEAGARGTANEHHPAALAHRRSQVRRTGDQVRAPLSRHQV